MSRHSIVLGPTKGLVMACQSETKLWMRLFEQAANEQNPKRLIELVKEINELSEERGRRGGWNHGGLQPARVCGKNPRTDLLPLRIAFSPERN